MFFCYECKQQLIIHPISHEIKDLPELFQFLSKNSLRDKSDHVTNFDVLGSDFVKELTESLEKTK